MARERNISKAIIVPGDALDPSVGVEKLALFNPDGSPLVLGGSGSDNTIVGKAVPALGAEQDGYGWIYDHDAGGMVWTELALKSDLDAHIADATIHSSGRQIAYVELTSNHTITFTDSMIPGFEFVVPAGERPVMLRLFARLLHSAGTLPYEVITVLRRGVDPATDVDVGNPVWQRLQTAGIETLLGEIRVLASETDRTFRIAGATNLTGRSAILAAGSFFEAVER